MIHLVPRPAPPVHQTPAAHTLQQVTRMSQVTCQVLQVLRILRELGNDTDTRAGVAAVVGDQSTRNGSAVGKQRSISR